MADIHFTKKTINWNGDEHYDLTIDGENYVYNKTLDDIENVRTGELYARLELPTDLLKAFHQAWDPEAYQQTHVNEYGFPEAGNDPDSPLYNPDAPQGEPVELRKQLAADRAAHTMVPIMAGYALAVGRDGLDEETARRMASTINSLTEKETK